MKHNIVRSERFKSLGLLASVRFAKSKQFTMMAARAQNGFSPNIDTLLYPVKYRYQSLVENVNLRFKFIHSMF